jgi:phage shock protein A
VVCKRAASRFNDNDRHEKEATMASSILGRMSQLVRANVNALLDQAEDPEKMLDQLLRDFSENIAEAEQAVAQTVGNLRLLEDDLREAQEAETEWGGKANSAASKAGSLRAAGQTAEADRFDELARVALRRQISYEQSVKTMHQQVGQQTALTNQLKDGLNKLRTKREDLSQKRDELVSRAKMARAQTQVQQAVRDVSVMDPSSELNRFEDRIRHEEAMARGMAEVSASSLEDQFAQLEDDETESEVEARLAAMQGSSGGSTGSGVGGSSGAGA